MCEIQRALEEKRLGCNELSAALVHQLNTGAHGQCIVDFVTSTVSAETRHILGAASKGLLHIDNQPITGPSPEAACGREKVQVFYTNPTNSNNQTRDQADPRDKERASKVVKPGASIYKPCEQIPLLKLAAAAAARGTQIIADLDSSNNAQPNLQNRRCNSSCKCKRIKVSGQDKMPTGSSHQSGGDDVSTWTRQSSQLSGTALSGA
ncbi:hypothetical protein PoB_006574300 [Plakobranchus ocellatus]|uniref:Uncharacterized protein n=1 Tax=Plakobranchus ocellatus TaxID=259542 RepID=A0AAV4D4U9_9GAST|nr:hypothetical protein PoB_006574300 [Plakobranchus ocellatus]